MELGQLFPLIKKHKLAFVDLETTGLIPSFGDRICEVGIIISSGFKISEVYTTLVNPQRSISWSAFRVNRITDSMVVKAPMFSEIVDKISSLLEGSIFISHNVPFDLGFLNYELSLLNLPPLFNPTLDTLWITRNFLNLPHNDLTYVANHFNLRSKYKRHRALGDAFLTYLLLKKIYSIFCKHAAIFT